MSLVERIDTICLTVRNVEEASRWYQEVLGFQEFFRGENYRILTIGKSTVPLTIEEGYRNSSASSVYPIFYAKDIEQVFDTLKNKDVKLSQLQHDGDNTFFDVYDLDGNKLQICYWE